MVSCFWSCKNILFVIHPKESVWKPQYKKCSVMWRCRMFLYISSSIRKHRSQLKDCIKLNDVACYFYCSTKYKNNFCNLTRITPGTSACNAQISASTHGGGRALYSDWYQNSFIMVVYEKNFFYSCLRQKILTEHQK